MWPAINTWKIIISNCYWRTEEWSKYKKEGRERERERERGEHMNIRRKGEREGERERGEYMMIRRKGERGGGGHTLKIS